MNCGLRWRRIATPFLASNKANGPQGEKPGMKSKQLTMNRRAGQASRLPRERASASSASASPTRAGETPALLWRQSRFMGSRRELFRGILTPALPILLRRLRKTRSGGNAPSTLTTRAVRHMPAPNQEQCQVAPLELTVTNRDRHGNLRESPDSAQRRPGRAPQTKGK